MPEFTTFEMPTIHGGELGAVMPKFQDIILEQTTAFKRHYKLRWYGRQIPFPNEAFKTLKEMSFSQKLSHVFTFGKKKFLKPSFPSNRMDVHVCIRDVPEKLKTKLLSLNDVKIVETLDYYHKGL